MSCAAVKRRNRAHWDAARRRSSPGRLQFPRARFMTSLPRLRQQELEVWTNSAPKPMGICEGTEMRKMTRLASVGARAKVPTLTGFKRPTAPTSDKPESAASGPFSQEMVTPNQPLTGNRSSHPPSHVAAISGRSTISAVREQEKWERKETKRKEAAKKEKKGITFRTRRRFG